jgi:hypothetical protein
MTRERNRLPVALAGASLALVLAACGSSKPSVAGVGTVATGTHNPANVSKCMRAHGVPNFPDPKAGPGGLGFPGGLMMSSDGSMVVDGINLGDGPALKAAEKACKAYLPGGAGPPPPISAARRTAMLANAHCMREHGVPNFPDPTFPGQGGVAIGLGKGVNPASPAFQAAAKACGGPGARIGSGP